MNLEKGSILFAGQAYYQAWYLSRELRKLGWKADVLNWDTDEASQDFYHGEDFRFTSSTTLEEQFNFFKYALETYDVFHFTNAHCLKFGHPLHELFAARLGAYGEIRILKARGKKIVYTNNGCPDGVSKTVFNQWKPYPNCEICRCKDKPEVCSDERNLEWGRIRNELADYQCIFGGNRADYNDDPRVHEEPSVYCLDPEFWRPDLAVPPQYQLTTATVKIYHAVANYDLRSSSSGKNIKCTHIYLPLIDRLKAEGYPVELVFAKDVPNQEVRFLQVQADIVVDMLTYGFFGANIREGLMLGKTCVCFLRPEWLESMRSEIPEYVDELPVVSATPETIYDVLVDLITNHEKRKEIGERSRRFAVKWHSAEAGARRFDLIYSALIDGRDVPPVSCGTKWERRESINSSESQREPLLPLTSNHECSRILIILNYPTDPARLRATIRDHIYCFKKYADCSIDYFNYHYDQELPQDFLTKKYDLIIFHTVFLSARWNKEGFRKLIAQPNVQILKQFDAVKIALPQDEFLHTDILCDFINEYEISHIFSVSPPSEWGKIYPNVDRNKVRIHEVLTGYLDDDTVSRINQLSTEEPSRTIDIGYRAYHSPFWLGRHGQLKWQIAEIFNRIAPAYGLRCDISTNDKDTFHDDDWYRFMLKCRYFIGVEGGASILDHDGSIRMMTDAFVAAYPQATFEEAEAACFPGLDGTFKFIQCSPRHLEACATRTCQVLIEGRFNEILTPWVHYLPLRKDFSNLQEILQLVKEDSFRRSITEAAYEDIAGSGRYSSRSFVDYVINSTIGS